MIIEYTEYQKRYELIVNSHMTYWYLHNSFTLLDWEQFIANDGHKIMIYAAFFTLSFSRNNPSTVNACFLSQETNNYLRSH